MTVMVKEIVRIQIARGLLLAKIIQDNMVVQMIVGTALEMYDKAKNVMMGIPRVLMDVR